MTKVTPIRRPAPLNNLRPISDPRITAEAMVCAIEGITSARPAGLCETRWRILRCIHAHPDGTPSRAELRLCSALSDKALSEHVQGLRWKGLILFETLALSPSATAMMGDAIDAEVLPESLPEPRPGRGNTAGEADDVESAASPVLIAQPNEESAAAPVPVSARADCNPSGPAAVQPAKTVAAPLFARKGVRLVDVFSNHLARGKTPDQAAGVMGFDANFSARMMQRIARDNGELPR